MLLEVRVNEWQELGHSTFFPKIILVKIMILFYLRKVWRKFKILIFNDVT